jgi:hypothetical protein
VAPVVAAPAELGLPALGLERAGVGPEPEIAASDGRRLARLRRADRPAAVAVGAVDPAVEAELESIDPVLLVPLDEAREEDLAAVGLAVAVAVLGVEDVGGAGDDDAIPPGNHAGRESQPVEEDGHPVIAAVAVGVLQDADQASRLPLTVDPEGIIAHLHDPEPAVGAPVERDRVPHQRLRGGQLHRETVPDPDRAERMLGRPEGGETGHIGLGGESRRAVARHQRDDKDDGQ